MSVTISEAVSAVRSLLDEQGWNYTFQEEQNVIKAEISLSKTKIGSLPIIIGFLSKPSDASLCRAISSLALPDVSADENCMTQMGEYLHLANLGLHQGHFVLNYSDSRILFRHGVSCEDGLPTQRAIGELLALPSRAFNQYGDGMLAIGMGLRTAMEAWQAARNQ